jgi:ADP-heptose:LPS heptosyltransferase
MVARSTLPISLLSWGGIGDTLRNISQVPHEAIYRRTGLRSRVFYTHWTRTSFNVSTGPPDPAWFRDIVERCPSLVWCGEVERYNGIGRWVNLALRRGIGLLSGRTRYFPFVPRLSQSEHGALPPRSERRRVAVQTHLSGMRTKAWGTANWRRYLTALLSSHPAVEIFLFDADPNVSELCIDERVQTTRRFNIPQSIVFLATCDLLVSIDSWTKYIAAAHDIPQVLVVPDQRTEYPDLSPDRLLRQELDGIYGRSDTEVIGISRSASPKLTLPSLAQLTPDELLAATHRGLERLR